MVEINIPDEGRLGIEKLLEFGAGGIDNLRSALDGTGPTLISVRQRALLVNEAMGANRTLGDVEQVLRTVVFPIRMFQLQLKLSGDQVHQTIGEFIEKESTQANSMWNERHLLQWNQLRTQIVNLLECRTVTIETKAIRLLRYRPSLYSRIQVFSDSRPLFTDDCEGIEISLITNTMRIEYRDGRDLRVLHLSLDRKDLEDFQNQISRAIKKNDTIRRENERHAVETLEFQIEHDEM